MPGGLQQEATHAVVGRLSLFHRQLFDGSAVIAVTSCLALACTKSRALTKSNPACAGWAVGRLLKVFSINFDFLCQAPHLIFKLISTSNFSRETLKMPAFYLEWVLR